MLSTVDILPGFVDDRTCKYQQGLGQFLLQIRVVFVQMCMDD